MKQHLAGRGVRVCPSPALYPYYAGENQITVVVDILRATSAICAALYNGVKSVIPVSTVEQALGFKGPEIIYAAERNGQVVEGFSYGNSPLSYINNSEVIGKTLVLSTTNGTQAIEIAKNNGPLVIGAFSNLHVLADFLIRERQEDVLVLCAGWKNKFNLEDTLFAGALSEILIQNGYGLETDADTTLMSIYLYNQSRADLLTFLMNSSHQNRLKHLNLKEDIDWCLQYDTAPVIPLLREKHLIHYQSA